MPNINAKHKFQVLGMCGDCSESWFLFVSFSTMCKLSRITHPIAQKVITSGIGILSSYQNRFPISSPSYHSLTDSSFTVVVPNLFLLQMLVLGLLGGALQLYEPFLGGSCNLLGRLWTISWVDPGVVLDPLGQSRKAPEGRNAELLGDQDEKD